MNRHATKQEWEVLRREFTILRKALGTVSQDEAADILGVSQSAVSAFERGDMFFREEVMAKIQELVAEWRDTLNRASISGPLSTVGGGAYISDHVCDQCGHKVPGPDSGVKWCVNCGNQLGKACSACSAVNAMDAKECKKCKREL